MQQHEIEELLELIWTLREKTISEKKVILEQTTEKNPERILEKMVKDSLIVEKGKKILLSDSGENYAKQIIRRHRLAERLFKDVFSMHELDYEKDNKPLQSESIKETEQLRLKVSYARTQKLWPNQVDVLQLEQAFLFDFRKSLYHS